MTLAAIGRSDESSRLDRLRSPLGVALGIGAATAALRLRDPHQHGSWGFCPFKALTGWDCPACGGLRAVNDLGHGDVAAALHSNLVFVSAVPVLVALWALWVSNSWRGIPTPRRTTLGARGRRVAWVGAAIVLVAFTVYRNTPAGSALYVG